MCASRIMKRDNVGAILGRALDAGGGLLRLTPTWVPRSFSTPVNVSSFAQPIGTPWARIAAASTSGGSPAPPRRPTKVARSTKA